MIQKTEKEIMSNWINNDGNPLVSISCTAYNHENYIERALDSFLSQVTNFPFEIIVHDDASTDNTASIIRKYENKYPHVICAIYEKENVYSKKDNSLRKIMESKIRGKYVALCECDDYWIDNNKLQKQYDLMEKNNDCVLCVHNTIIHDLLGKRKDKYFNVNRQTIELSPYDIFTGWNVHYSSYFFRSFIYKKVMDFPNSEKYYFGDFLLLCLSIYYGKIIYLPDVMSVYNINNKNGLTYQYDHIDSNTQVNRELLKIDFINDYNEYTSNKYIDITSKVLDYYRLLCALYRDRCKDILKDSKYHKAFSGLSFSMKLKIFLRAYFPNLFIFLKKIRNLI